MKTHLKTDPCRTIVGADPWTNAPVYCGHDEQLHTHDRDGSDCGICVRCKGYDLGVNWAAVLTAIAIVGALLAAILGRLVGWL